jgi:hypothetical protein
MKKNLTLGQSTGQCDRGYTTGPLVEVIPTCDPHDENVYCAKQNCCPSQFTIRAADDVPSNSISD